MRPQGRVHRRKRAPCWSYSAGAKGQTVTVYERVPGGPLQARCFDETLRDGRGGYRRLALGHRDQEKAKGYALDQAAKLLEGRAELVEGTIARLFAAYRTHRTPHKSLGEQGEDARRITMWTMVLGARKDPHLITRGEWERFIELRRTGAIDALGAPVPEPEPGKPSPRHSVRDGTVRSDCLWLRQVLGWGTTWRDGENGPYLVRENPVRGFAVPQEKNIRRPVATTDRFEALRKVSDRVPMELRRGGKRETVRSYLSELLDLVHGTGRRVSAVLALRYENLQLAKTKAAPHGAIAWPGETDKMGKAWSAPIGASVRAALERVQRERPGIGAAYLFPSAATPEKPVSYEEARRWLLEAERRAEVAKQDGSSWHAYRRGWATSRKHLPVADVALAGGWESTETLQRCYQQPDPATILAVVLGGAELREVQA
jgi:integrase-like protein